MNDENTWIDINDKNNPIPKYQPVEVLFETGLVLDYDDEWPALIVTHWRIKNDGI